MHPTALALLVEQIGHEYANALLYLSLHLYFESVSLSGFSKWAWKQHTDEIGHAEKIVTYLADRRVIFSLPGIEAPPSGVQDPLDAMTAAFMREQETTARIKAIYQCCMDDPQTCIFLQWFLTEQIEEEKTTNDWMVRLQIVQDNPAGLIELDERIGED